MRRADIEKSSHRESDDVAAHGGIGSSRALVLG